MKQIFKNRNNSNFYYLKELQWTNKAMKMNQLNQYIRNKNNFQGIDSINHLKEKSWNKRFIYDNIVYAELNTKSDYCEECGYDGEIRIVEDEEGKLKWKCPNCGNMDQSKMSVARRTCGYIGTQFWNQGRTQEIRDRVLHL